MASYWFEPKTVSMEFGGRTLTLETREGTSVKGEWQSDVVRANTGAVLAIVHTLVALSPTQLRR